MTRHGFTLLEMLAVAMLLGLVAGVTLTAWRPHGSATAGPLSTLSAFDQAIRDAAREHGGYELLMTDAGLNLLPGDGSPATVRPPSDYQVLWSRPDGTPQTRITYDQHGFNQDLLTTLFDPTTRHEWQFLVGGISGVITPLPLP
jgi:prepilin-type N-terminal cleavage/methylation domain-containing protein